MDEETQSAFESNHAVTRYLMEEAEMHKRKAEAYRAFLYMAIGGFAYWSFREMGKNRNRRK